MKPTLARRLFGRVLGGWLEPVLQPRLAMGMGVAALSFFMLEPKVHQLTPSDLDPVKVWAPSAFAQSISASGGKASSIGRRCAEAGP